MTGMVMMGYVDVGVATAYKDYVVNLAKTYPKSWWIICTAEWELRFEWAVSERRRQR